MSAIRSVTWPLLVFNLCLYVVVAALAGWVMNSLIDVQLIPVTDSTQATYSLAIFALISAAAGIGSMVAGLHHMYAWSLESFSASAAVAGVSLVLSLEALGFASKEIYMGVYRHPTVKALEALAIIVGATQLFYVMVLQVAKIQGEFS